MRGLFQPGFVVAVFVVVAVGSTVVDVDVALVSVKPPDGGLLVAGAEAHVPDFLLFVAVVAFLLVNDVVVLVVEAVALVLQERAGGAVLLAFVAVVDFSAVAAVVV